MPTKPDQIHIGSFQKPKSDVPPQVKREETELKTPAKVDKTELETALSQEAADTEAQLKPLESYEDELKKASISKEEAAAIVDDLLFKGFYREVFPVTTRMSVVFRTRNYADTLRINSALEVLRPSYQVGYDEMVYRFSLAASLESLGTTVFKFPSSTDTKETQDKYFDERLKFIETLPEMTVHLLYSKLTKFDNKVRIVLKEGAIENF